MDLFDSKSASPMLIAEETEPFDSPDYIYELKLDGERGLSYLSSETVLRNKRQLNMLAKFPELDGIHKQVKQRCILDGEYIVIIDGKPDFSEVRRRSLMSSPFKIKLAADKYPVSFAAYDILYLKDKPLLDLPLMERKEILAKIVTESPKLSISRYIETEGVKLFNLTRQQGLEGVVAKRAQSKYFCGKRTKDWIKFKNLQDDDYVICGYIIKSDAVTSLVLAQYRNARLVYKGHVTLGVSRNDFTVISDTEHTSNPFPGTKSENTIWIKPVNVCKVEFMERYESGSLRQPVYKGLRLDKKPEECVEKP